TVDIYNIKGQKVLNLMDSTTVPGTFKFTWNGTDADNRPVASGQYFVKVVQKGRTTASKMMVIK
ncbi:MAG: T9SS type A sorting domain-containing protein, partial [Candidatus Cloacimonetes bacterium]|nr:T9SS type A sorting domain-containing protein [Candidatus Cloacimonadota bacterium]